MASRTLDVRINARDSASQVFKKVGDASKTMGDSIDRAADEGTRSLKDLDRQADATGDKFNTLVDRATAVGAALGTVGTVLIALGSSYRDQERQIDGINRLYGEQSDAILEMSENIQDFTRYSNDAARESALIAGSLSTNYELTADQIEILVERSADLAQIFGVDLVDAVTRTSAAIRGEGEAAERLSLNMSDAAIAARALDAGITNWNVPGALSEAEKAAFRFQVFLEDTEGVVGAAAAAADDAGGSFRQFANTLQDTAQRVGGLLGPVGQIAAEFAPIAIAMPVVGAGLANLGRNAVVARSGMAALAIATSPVSVALAGIVSVGAVVIENMRRQGEAADNYAASLRDLDTTLEVLLRRGDDALVAQAEAVQQQLDETVTALERYEEGALHFYETLNLAEQGVDPSQFAGLLTTEYAAAADLIDDVTNQINEALSDPNIDASAYFDFIEEMLNTVIVTAQGSNVDEVLTEILTRPLSEFRIEAEETFRGVLGPFGLPSSRQAEIISWETFTETVRDNIEAQEDEISVSELVAATHGDSTAALYDLIEAQREARQEWIASARAIGGFDDALSTINLAGMASDASLFAENIQTAGVAFDNTFRILVTNVQGIGSTVQQATDWMEELVSVNERGVYTINELAVEGRISWGEAEAAVAAYNETAERNYDIQQNLLAIQALQAPFVAQQVEATQQYVAELANMDAETQRVTLAFMDLQTVQTAQEIVALGNAEAFRTMGGEGEAAFEAMINGAIQANPLLFDVLETMGIISGTPVDFDINFDALAEGGSAIQQLTDSVEDLVSTLREIYGLPPLEVEVATSITGPLAGSDGLGLLAGGTNALLEHLGIPDRVEVPITPTIEGASGVGDGTGGAGNFRDMLGIPDTVDVVVNAVLSTFGGLGGIAGGAVASFADALGIPDQVDVPVAVTGDDKLATVQDTIASLPESTTVSVVIDVDDSELEGLGAFGIYSGGNEGGGAAALPEYRIPVSIDVSGTDELADVAETLLVLNLAETTPSVNVDTSGFVSGFDLVKGHIADLDDDEPTVSIDGAPGLWAVHYDKVKSQVADLDDDVATVTIDAVNNASAVIGLVSGSLALLDGRTATTYVDTVQRTFVQTVGRPAGVRHGGIPSFASGGMVPFWAGENGLEVAHFATGGTALLPTEGLYAAPPMTYISPNNAVSTSYGGDVNITIQHYGGGADEFDRMVETRLVPAVERAVTRSNRAAGVR